ncbi:MAG: AMP-binding protein, partial [bacterium]|nr:AMP-binding protein [bacterium]
MKPLDKANVEDILSLTPIQEGMLFHILKAPESEAYSEQLCIEVSGNLERNFFQQAWNAVIRANEVLRTVFRWEKMEKPVQAILKEYKIEPLYYDITDKKEERDSLVEDIKLKDRAKRFDLRDVPFRVTVCRVSEERHLMIISNHHILYDGWSNGIILKEFFEAYNMTTQGTTPAITPKTKFKEFVKWLQTRDLKKQETFWKDYLKGLDTQRGLSIKNKRKEIKTGIKKKCNYPLPEPLVNQLQAYAAKEKVTAASLLNCAWGLLLQKYNNSDDVLFGTTVSGREAKLKGIEEIAGLFINTVPLRVKTVSGEKTAEQKETAAILTIIRQIDHHLRHRREHENTPLVNIKEYSNINAQEELFDTLVVIENYPLDERLKQEGGALVIESFSVNETTHYDLTVAITMFDGIQVEMTYNNALFEKEKIRQLSRHFSNILEEVIKSPAKTLAQISMLSKAEEKQLLFEFNDTAAELAGTGTLYELFAGQAEKTPQRIALTASRTGADTGKQFKERLSLTYGQLYNITGHLAVRLREKGGSGTIVGVIAGRSPEMVAAIYAILGAGAAYLPIEPDYPPERIRYILQDSGAKLVLSEDKWLSKMNEANKGIDAGKQAEVIELTIIKEGSAIPHDAAPLPTSRNRNALAYIIYTS